MITAANYLVFVEQFSALTDEQVYARLCYTVSKESIRYQVVLLLMGGFYQIMDDTSEQQLKWPHALSKIFHYFWPLFQLYERTDLNNIYKQSVILSNIYKYVSFAYDQ